VPADVYVIRGNITEAFMIMPVVVVFDEGNNSFVETGRPDDLQNQGDFDNLGDRIIMSI
jgi:hypothetical protein